MAHQKQTSFRILQATKKNHYPAVGYGMLGFCIGVICSAIVSYSYIHNLKQELENRPALFNISVSEQDISANTQPVSRKIASPSLQPDSQISKPIHEDEHAIEFPQPTESDLSKAFVHPAQAKPDTRKQNSSKHLVQPQPHSSLTQAKTTVTSTSVQKSSLTNKQAEAKNSITEKSPVSVKELEVNETPQASVHTAVTRTPVIQKDSTVTP